MVGNFFACCARAASGHAAAAPSATSSSRRPMVTVIRPSRARCVKTMISRHECAVFTRRAGARHSRCLSSGRTHTCCGVVSHGCCDVSAPRGAVLKISAALLPPPKPAIACTS